MADELRIVERPALRRPIMISAFRGWNDGGQGATLAAGFLARVWSAARFAEIDPENFFDFQATRPHVSLVDGRTRKIDWPDTASVTAPWGGGFFHALESACRTYQPNAVVTPSICVGGTDARHFRERGIPSYGLVPGMFTAEDLKGFHGVDERMSIANLLLGTQIIWDATLRIAAGRPADAG